MAPMVLYGYRPDFRREGLDWRETGWFFTRLLPSSQQAVGKSSALGGHLLVGGLEHCFFPYIGNNHPN